MGKVAVNSPGPLQKLEFSVVGTEKVNILVVDDLPEKLLVYRTILEELNQNLFTVSSGSDALKLVLKHEFAVILLDVNMPGMDGFETATLILNRKKSARTPIIFLTAFTDEVYAAQGYASGAVDYLLTPVVPEILRAKIRVFIELTQMRKQAASQAEERALLASAEASARRSEFLVNASKVLTSSYKRSEIVNSLIKLPIPYLAETSMLWLTNDEMALEKIEWSSSPIKPREDSDPNIMDIKQLPWLEKVIINVLKTGKMQILKDIIPPQIEFPDNQLSLKELNLAIALPLSVRGKILGILVLARTDITDTFKKDEISLSLDFASRASAALENISLIEKIQEADKRKDEFLVMLAHELRNPLAPIRNAVHLLKLMGPQEPNMVKVRDIIDRQIRHMVRLIDDLLDVKRLAHGKILLRKERCDLTKIVEQTAQDYLSIFENSGLKLDVHTPPVSLWVEGDPTRLIQSIGNLLHNAHKFTNKGGLVTISLELQKDGHAAIMVSDTGIGIEPQLIPYVFDVFRQAEQGLDRSTGGLGLGLALVKGLVELHDGEVSVTSAGDGKGTKFTVRIPVNVMPQNVSSEVSENKVSGGRKYRILVIEDNKDAAESAKLILSFSGHNVKVAHTGTQGIEMAKSFSPHIILCDIGLPGMDGYQVARTLRLDPENEATYIIALTGYGRNEDQNKASEAGFYLHLTKPIDYNVLLSTIEDLPVKEALVVSA